MPWSRVARQPRLVPAPSDPKPPGQVLLRRGGELVEPRVEVGHLAEPRPDDPTGRKQRVVSRAGGRSRGNPWGGGIDGGLLRFHPGHAQAREILNRLTR